jgi:hypothetical protein
MSNGINPPIGHKNRLIGFSVRGYPINEPSGTDLNSLIWHIFSYDSLDCPPLYYRQVSG